MNYNHPTHGQVGHCIDQDQCPYDNYISNLCPTKPADVKCCFSKPDNSAPPGEFLQKVVYNSGLANEMAMKQKKKKKKKKKKKTLKRMVFVLKYNIKALDP